MYNVCKYTVLQRKLQILERTWFWSAQTACAYHFVGREWIRLICGSGKNDFSALISFAFEERHSSLPCGSKLFGVSQNLHCNIISMQSWLWVRSSAGKVTVPEGFGNLVCFRTGMFVSILQILCTGSNLIKNQTSLMDFWQDGSFT